MSLINKMLQDLDARGNARSAAIASDVKPVAPETRLRSKRRIAAITAGLLAVAIGVTAWGLLPIKGKSFDPKPARPLAQAPLPAPPAPVASTEPAPVTVAETAPAAATPPAAKEAVAPEAAVRPDSAKTRAPRRTPATAPAPAPSSTTWAVAQARAQAEEARLARRWAAEEARIATLPADERGAAEARLHAEQEKAAVTARTNADWIAALKRREAASATTPADAAADAGPGRSETPLQRADNAYRRALASLQDGRVSEAISGLQQTLRANPRHDAARQTLVGLLIENKRNDEAMSELQGALALDPRQPAMAMLLARLQIERGGNGIETLQRTLPYAAGNGEYHAFLAGALQRQGRQREAVEQYGNALRSAPGNGVWWMGLGISLQAEKRNPEAADAFRRAQESGTLSSELQGFVERKLQQVAP